MKPCLWCSGMDRRGFLRSLLLLGGGVMGGFLRGRGPAWAFSVISPAKEEAIGKQAHPEILKQFGYYKDAAVQAYVTQVGQRVLQEAESSPFTFQFTVVDHPMVNAFAVPGGFVYLTRGILADLNSENEMATILGHEIAHVTSHHSVEQMTRALGAQILTLGLAVVSPGGREHAAGWLALSSEISNQILLGYGREAELESDEKGIRWATKAGYDPRGMISFMRTLQITNRLSGMGYHAFRATHPDTLERIDRARVMIEILDPPHGRFLDTPGERSLAVKADEYKDRIDGLVYGAPGEQKRVRVITAQGGESLKEMAKTLWGTENRAWDLALLNGIRDEDLSLQAGQKLKVIYDPYDDLPLTLPQDLSRTLP